MNGFVDKIERSVVPFGLSLWREFDRIERHAMTGGKGVRVRLIGNRSVGFREYRFGNAFPQEIAYAVLYAVVEEMVKNDFFRFEVELF